MKAPPETEVPSMRNTRFHHKVTPAKAIARPRVIRIGTANDPKSWISETTTITKQPIEKPEHNPVKNIPQYKTLEQRMETKRAIDPVINKRISRL